jgi:hypothetical protein
MISFTDRRLAACALAIGALALFVGGVARAQNNGDPGGEFLPIYRVLESPRCMNCHPDGDRPHTGDERRLHRMNISRKSPDAGLPCSTCHRSHNAPFTHGPPGVPGWQMPPAEHPMPFEKRSAHDLCEQMKDPKQNGGKSLADLRAHFAKDPVVLWAWDPGPGRSAPPLAHADLVRQVDVWIQKGAPCPK